MSCVVGLIHEGIVYVGADSLASTDYFKVTRVDKKVFKIDNTNSIIAYVGLFRMGQLLMFSEPIKNLNIYDNDINFEIMVNQFIPATIKTFEDGCNLKVINGEIEGGEFLFAHKNKLYKIESDFQVEETTDTYNASGVGMEFALGSLKTTEDMQLDPIHRIHLALKASSKFSTRVAPPYYILNTQNNEVVKFEE